MSLDFAAFLLTLERRSSGAGTAWFCSRAPGAAERRSTLPCFAELLQNKSCDAPRDRHVWCDRTGFHGYKIDTICRWKTRCITQTAESTADARRLKDRPPRITREDRRFQSACPRMDSTQTAPSKNWTIPGFAQT